MQEPKKPNAPHKPSEPKPFYEQEMTWEPPYGQKISLAEMFKALPEGIKPEQLQFERGEHYDEFDSYYYTKITYVTQVPNTRIKSETKAYPKKLAQYEKKKDQYKKNLEVYNEEMKVYIAWKEQEELKALEKRLVQLKKKVSK